MEYVRVQFPRSRNVEVDNAIVGKTNDILILEAGNHRFDLGQPVNYTPAFIDRVVKGTSPTRPMTIEFEAASAAVAAGSARIPVKAVAPATDPAPVAAPSPAKPAGGKSARSRSAK